MSFTERIAVISAKRPWTTVLVWVVLLIAGGALTMNLGDVLTSEFGISVKPDSAKADDLLEERLRGERQGQELVLITSENQTVNDPQFKAAAEQIIADLRAKTETVSSVISYYDTQAPGLVSGDQSVLVIPVNIIGDVAEGADNVEPVVAIVEEANALDDGIEVLTAGEGSIAQTFNEANAHDAEAGERIGIPIALIILLLVFGAAVAAGIPLVMAIVSIVVAFGIATLIGRGYELNILVTNIVPMIGLAVGIDYSLLIVQRFREERAHGLEKMDAIAMAGATASRTVVFSGGTVIVGLLGMMIVPSNVYRSIAIGTCTVCAVAVLSRADAAARGAEPARRQGERAAHPVRRQGGHGCGRRPRGILGPLVLDRHGAPVDQCDPVGRLPHRAGVAGADDQPRAVGRSRRCRRTPTSAARSTCSSASSRADACRQWRSSSMRTTWTRRPWRTASMRWSYPWTRTRSSARRRSRPTRRVI